MTGPTAANRRPLSARSTAFYRLLPILWVLAVAGVAWMIRDDSRTLLTLAPVALLPPLLMRRIMGDLRHVSTDGRSLFVSAGGREVPIPYEDVVEVREIHSKGRNRITTLVVTLRADSPVGREVRFVPRMRWWPEAEAVARAQSLQTTDREAAAAALWSSLSVAEEIRQRSREARERERERADDVSE